MELPLEVKDQDVSGLAESFHLAGEDLIEAEIVADASQGGGIGGQGDGGQGPAGGAVASDEFLAEVEGIAGAASVAGREHLASLLQAVGNEFSAAAEIG